VLKSIICRISNRIDERFRQFVTKDVADLETRLARLHLLVVRSPSDDALAQLSRNRVDPNLL